MNIGSALLLAATLLCATSWADQSNHSKKPKKAVPLQPLPSGPTGPVQQIPLDSLTAMPPEVTYQNNQLTIVAPNSTLADILRAVRKQTGAEIEVPSAPERVVTRLGPGPAREVLAELLNGSRFNYILLGSPADEAVLTRVVLVTKRQETLAPTNPPGTEPNPGAPQQPVAGLAQQPQEEAEQNDPDGDENADDSAEAAPETQPAQDQQNQKSPQQLMQEMQQRQMQLQQMQQPGQPPIPGPGIPPRPQPQ